MNIRSNFAIEAGKLTRWALQTFTNGGSSLPGKVAHAIDPHILKHLSDHYEVIIVSGTNGKTLTTSLIVQLLKQKYPNILTNPTGANLTQGIVSTFLNHTPVKGEKNIAVLEVDEATIKHITPFIQPKLFVFTNIFRDQMDRFGEIYTTYQFMLDVQALLLKLRFYQMETRQFSIAILFQIQDFILDSIMQKMVTIKHITIQMVFYVHIAIPFYNIILLRIVI